MITVRSRACPSAALPSMGQGGGSDPSPRLVLGSSSAIFGDSKRRYRTSLRRCAAGLDRTTAHVLEHFPFSHAHEARLGGCIVGNRPPDQAMITASQPAGLVVSTSSCFTQKRARLN
jgi:hypothetical protein